MAKKNIVTFTIELDLNDLTGLSVAERKNTIEQTFAANKEIALDAIAKKLA